MKHKQEKKRKETELELEFLKKFSSFYPKFFFFKIKFILFGFSLEKPPTIVSKSPNPKKFLRKTASTIFLNSKSKKNCRNISFSNSLNRDPDNLDLKRSLNLNSPMRKSEISLEKSDKKPDTFRDSSEKKVHINNFFKKDNFEEKSNENSEDFQEKSNEKKANFPEEKPTFIQKEKTFSKEKSLIKEENSENSNEKSKEKSVEISNNSEKTPDLQDYIQEQEAYLEKLEQDRRNLKKKMKEIDENPFENTAQKPFDFIQSLHDKENSFIDNSLEFSQRKAHDLLEKFLGNEKSEERKIENGNNFNYNSNNSNNFNSSEGLIVRNLKKTPNKTEGVFLRTKEGTPMSDLSYSLSIDPVAFILIFMEFIDF